MIEVICAVAIIAILTALIFTASGKLLGLSSSARCVSNLKNLHVAFAAYVGDYGYWPQQPDFPVDDKINYGNWWRKTMYPYTQNNEVWLCPSIKTLDATTPEEERSLIHYTPTLFDAFRNRPYQWALQPWLTESGNPHSEGGNILFPDGSVRNSKELIDSWK